MGEGQHLVIADRTIHEPYDPLGPIDRIAVLSIVLTKRLFVLRLRFQKLCRRRCTRRHIVTAHTRRSHISQATVTPPAIMIVSGAF